MLSLCVLNYCCMCKEAGGGGEGARDTESKTRTPHKVVGKNHDLGKAAGHNSVPPNKPHYCVSGLLMDYPLENCFSDVF